jgi:hypothetical protein
MKIRKYNELFSLDSLNRIDVEKPKFKSNIDECVYDILFFLKENDIITWERFINSGKFDRWVIDKMIDSYCKDMQEVSIVKYKIKLNIGSKKDLERMLADAVSDEEYEKCSEIKKKLDTLK